MFSRARVWSQIVVIGVLSLSAVMAAGIAAAEIPIPSRAPVPAAGSAGPSVDASAKIAGATDDWLSKVRAQIELDEYNASVNEDGLQAPNRAHNLRTYFGDGGIEVVPRTADGEVAWTFAWRTTCWGREGQLVDVAGVSVEPVPNGSRVTYARGGLEEWYENTSKGLEQGFVLSRRPAGSGPLIIEGCVGRDLKAEFRPGEGAIDFLDANGVRVLRYAELHVRDASGCEMPSQLRLEADRIVISVDDAEASYPLNADPLMTSPAWTAESDQAGARFGYSVGTAGDVNGDGFSDVIVGAHFYDNGQTDEGRAYVYRGSSAGLATSAAWTAESDVAGVQFGFSVGAAGDVNGDGYSDVIVGAPYYTGGGRAYVFVGSSGGLAYSPIWTAGCNQAYARYGYSVGTAGDVNGDGYSEVVVGAPKYSDDQTEEGRVYVYQGSAAGPSAAAVWTVDGDQTYGGMGYSVGVAGDVNADGYSDLIVGASSYDNWTGRAFVYHGSAAGLSPSAVWTVGCDKANALFGYSTGTAGDVNGDGYSDVLVGAYNYTNDQSQEGRAYLYFGSAAGLSLSEGWMVEGNNPSGWYGWSVGTAGDVNGDGYSDVLVGAYNYTHDQNSEGRAYLYYGSADGLASTADWTVEGDQVGAALGFSVGTAGDVNGDGFSDVIIGVPFYDNGQTDEGRACVYNGSAGGLATSAGWTAESDQESASFGSSVSTAGDVNGDGYSDVVVGAPVYDNGEADEGRAYVYHGSDDGLGLIAAWTAEGNQANAQFGTSVGTAGDVNGDGYSDLIVGAQYYDNGQADEGRAYVYHGSADGLGTSASWTAESDQVSAWFGASVGTAGDVSGDGFSDVIIGAYGYDNGQTNEGRAYVYHGSPAGLLAGATWTAESDQANARFGYSVGTAGDVNGDGYSDVIVGAYSYDNGETDEGRAFVYQGSESGLGTSPAWTAESDQAGAYFGRSVGTAGDVNGDGYSDIIAGASMYDNGETDEGRVYVYHGSGTGLSSTAAWAVESNQASAYLGSVGCAGDVNGDGYSDVIVGASMYDNDEADEGRAYVYHGSAGGLGASPVWIAESNQAGAAFGRSVGSTGDVNGDGYSDVIVGAYMYDNGETSEGSAFVYYGNEGDCLHRIPRQARADDSAPVAALGLSHSNDGFLLKAVGRTPIGRGNVRLQYEVKPLGTPFDGMGLVTGTAYSTGAPGGSGSAVDLLGLVSGLTSNTLYHWRLRTLTDSPFFPRSPWFTLPYNCVTEADVRTGTVVGVAEKESAPGALLLAGGAPNPFEGLVRVQYVLPDRGRVRVAAYDVSGRQVAVLRDAVEDVGEHVVNWDGRGDRGKALPAGVYFVQLNFGTHKESRKIVLTR